MLISVIYPDGKHDMVKDYLLTKMIEQQAIRQFKRSDGWISIDSDKVRGRGRKFYNGPERRQLDPSIPPELTDIFQ